MGTLPALTAIVGFGAMATSIAPAASANDWSIGIGLPGVVVVAPAPIHVPPPPRYYVSGYNAPGYHPLVTINHQSSKVVGT